MQTFDHSVDFRCMEVTVEVLSSRRTMSGFLILLSLIAAFSSTTADHVPVHLADAEFVSRQKTVYELLWHVDQALEVNPQLYKDGKDWDIKANIDLYEGETTVKDFLDLYDGGMLPRGEIFSVFFPRLMDEAVALYRLFNAAKDFDTFYKTAAWARSHVNEGQFMYAFSVAVVHRPDTKYMKLPTPDELYPHLFFDTEVIRQAHTIKMSHLTGSKDSNYVVLANRSLWFTRPQGDPEHKLNYFVEDVGLNGYYHTLNLEFPFWMSSDEFQLPKGRRGEQYYYTLRLLLNRYNLERLSNGLEPVEDIDWNEPITMGYRPMMSYRNGVHLPERCHDCAIPPNKYKCIKEVRSSEGRILEAIDSGFYTDVEGKLEGLYTPEGIEILGNIVEGNADSLNEKLYGSVDAESRSVLGFNPDPLSKHKVLPSSLQHFATSLRDPAFYRLCKRILGYFQRYKSNMEAYTPEQLGASSGLKIESVSIDKLETYFDHFDSVLNNAVGVRDNADAKSFTIKARQYRLTHKPFTYSMLINSDNDCEAMIRIFLGPKYNSIDEELDMTENYADFYEIDSWKVTLKKGKNEVMRNSHEARGVAPEQLGMDLFYKKLMLAMEKKEPLTYSEHVYGFPERLILPKGTKQGLPLRVFVHVMPCTEEDVSESESPLWGKSVTDGHPLGFPLDRPIKAKNLILSNMFSRDVFVLHKTIDEINATV